MTIEITRPELQLLIQNSLKSGAFENAQELILEALRSFHGEKPLMGSALVAAMQASPYRELELDPGRVEMPVREVDF